jgi:hypothetical protein
MALFAAAALAVLAAGCNGNADLYDFDGDGTLDEDDCSPQDASVFPSAEDSVGDDHDQNCDGVDGIDEDGDGFASTTSGGTDCNDSMEEINPEAPEVCNGVDDNCDGALDDVDEDGDGVVTEACGGDDCDDSNADVLPGAVDDCDDVDNDCDPSTLDGDLDGDGYPASDCDGQDCDDQDPDISPDAEEICDGVDNDCDNELPLAEQDGDGDGFVECAPYIENGAALTGGEDCLPNDGTAYPGAEEIVGDGIDQDCSGTDAVLCFEDSDGDGFGSTNILVAEDGDCEDAGESTVDTDCDDSNQASNPDATEVCNGVDENCNGQTDEGFPDTDGDLTLDCLDDDDDDDGSLDGDDCAPLNPAINPGAEEVCGDSIDNDCDGNTDDVDADNDGDTAEACGGYDCDDNDPNTYVFAPELCDGSDNNCDGLIPDDEVDQDGDGPSACAGDCDDGNASIFPGAPEICNDEDDDCDGAPGPGELDTDGDGYMVCESDCDDLEPAANPGETEICDTLDNNCDGSVDEGFPDTDGDGDLDCVDNDDDGDGSLDGDDCEPLDWEVFPGNTEVCNLIDDDCDGNVDNVDGDGDGYTVCADDCDDTDPAINPGETEICDTLDNNCDGSVDEGFPDTDGDGDLDCFDNDDDGDGSLDGDDCEPTDPSIFPDAIEECNLIDDNCDGDVDDVDADGDGAVTDACVGGDDCDDSDPFINPSEPEVCDTLDNNCDGAFMLGEIPVGPTSYMSCLDDQTDGVDGATPDGIDEDGNFCDVAGFVPVDGVCLSKYHLSIDPVLGIAVSVGGVFPEVGNDFAAAQLLVAEIGGVIPGEPLVTYGCGGPASNTYPYGDGSSQNNLACPMFPTTGGILQLTGSMDATCTSTQDISDPLGNVWELVYLPNDPLNTWGLAHGSANSGGSFCGEIGYSEISNPPGNFGGVGFRAEMPQI